MTTRARATSGWRDLTPPGYDPWAQAEGYRFDPHEAGRACGFFRDLLKHYKGADAGKPFLLQPWQQAAIGHLWGWRDKEGFRRYRECFLFVPRKNGKTHLAAGVALLLLYGDGEKGGEVYSAAAERDQAALVFEAAKQMVLAEPALSEHARVYHHSIVIERMASFYKAISAEAKSKHGFNASGLVIDELHAHRDRELVDVLMTSTGSRRQPLTIHLTTAGYDRHSICYEKYDYAKKVREGIIEDPRFMPVIWESDTDADWTDPEVWRGANPNLGISLDYDYLMRECQRAKDSPGYENTFRRLHLNQWTEQDCRWFSMDVWDRGGSRPIPDLSGKECWAGLDLSSTTDLTALVLVFPEEDGFYVLPICWIPEENCYRREKRDRAPYVGWKNRGLIETTEGNSIDYGFIRRRINELAAIYRIRSIAIDRWNATQLAQELTGDGFNVEAFGQGFASMNAPSKRLEGLLLDGKLWHGKHPVLRWCAANCAAEQDAAGNLKPSKAKSNERIDAVVALVMALGAAGTQKIEAVFTGAGVW